MVGTSSTRQPRDKLRMVIWYSIGNRFTVVWSSSRSARRSARKPLIVS